MSTKKNILEFVREQDFVEYFLFPEATPLDNKEEELMINSVLREVNLIAKKYTKDYIWHRDEFKLTARTSISNYLCNEDDREDLPAHLYGVTHFGDNIEDEWFIVHLLTQLTKEIKGLVVRVVDSDNEFLLIEAADFLPSWAKPETCSQRVYLYDGKLHIIAPLENSTNGYDEVLKVTEAVSEIRRNPSLTIASHDIQAAINKKTKDYPARIKENLHRTKAYLPVAIAAILSHKPNLIAPAILAFCNRDSIDLRACRAMKYFPPENRIYCSVTFTKFLYAMITHSKYLPEKNIGWELPPASSEKYKAQLLGVKIACGFEILASQAKSSADVESDKAWHGYLNSLKAKGYFHGLLEHSKEYDSLLSKAREFYKENRDSMQSAPIVGQEIVQLSRNLDKEEVVRNEGSLPEDDSEEWLNISAEDLDHMLQERYGGKNNSTSLSKTDAGNFSKKITNFLEHISTTDGAEFPDADLTTTQAPPPSLNSNSNSKPKNGENINFDPNSFSCAVQNILNFVIPEDDSWDLESDSDMDDYGHEDEREVPMEYGELKTKMKEYMDQMDAELANTTISESFVTKSEEEKGRDEKDNFDDIENFKPIDIDMNALKNILESYKSQLGEAGPSSTMLGPMGFHLEKEVDSD